MGDVVADLIVKVNGEGSGAISEMNRVQSRFSALADGVKATGSSMANAVGTAFGFVAAQVIARMAQMVGSLISTGLEFGKQMQNVNSIIQVSDNKIRDLSNAVIALASDPRIIDSPANLAEGLYLIVSAGFDATDSMTILKESAIAATAGLTTTATSVDAITTVLLAYGMGADQAAHVSNVLFETVAVGKLTYEQLATSIGNVIPTAAALNVPIEQVGAAIAALTLQGKDAASASTYLNGVFLALLKPTADLTAGLAAHGYASGQDALAALGLTGTLDLLNTIIKEGTGNVADYVADSRAMRAVMGLNANGGKLYADALVAMSHAQDGTGATAKALAKQMESASFQIAKAKQEVQILATVLVGALSPAIILASSILTLFLSKTLIPLSQAFNEFSYLMLRAFAEGPKVSTLLEHIPAPLQSIARLLLEAADFWGRLTRGMEGAFASGEKIDHFLRGVPGPLREFSRGVLTVADAFGDLVHRYQSQGFEAMLKTLPRELNQVVDGLAEMARGAASAFLDIAISGAITFGGDLLAALGNVVGWILDQLAGGNWAALAVAAIPVTLAPITIYGLIKLAGDLLSADGHFWSYIRGRLGLDPGGGGSGLGVLADERGGASRAPIPIPDLIVEGAIQLSGMIGEAEGDLLGWVRRKLMGFTGLTNIVEGIGDNTTGAGSDVNHTIPLGTLAVTAGLKLADDIFGAAGTLWQWFENAIGVRAGDITVYGQAHKPVSLGDVTVNVEKWLVHSAESIADAVIRFGTAASLFAKSLAIDLASVAVNVAGWVAGKIPSVWDWLHAHVVAAGLFAKGAGVDLYDVAVNVVGWAEGTIPSVWDWLRGHMAAVGLFAKAAGVDLVGVLVNVVSWAKGVIGPISSADLSAWAQTAVDAVKDASAALSNWKLTVKTPSGANLVIDVGGIVAAIFDAIWKYTDVANLTLPKGSDEKAHQIGENLGNALAKLIGDGFGTPNAAGKQGNRDPLNDVARGFIGGFTDALLMSLGKWENDQLVKLDRWATNFATEIRVHVHDAIFGQVKAIQGPDGPQTAQVSQGLAGVFDGLLDVVEQPHVPDWMSNWSWLTDAIDTGIRSVYNWIINNTPDWMQKLANGDWSGAVSAVFAGKQGSSATGSQGDYGTYQSGGQAPGGPQFGSLNNTSFQNLFFDDMAAAAGLVSKAIASSMPGTTQEGTTVTTLPGVGSGTALPPHANPPAIPAPDMGAFNKAIQFAQQQATNLGRLRPTPKLDADISGFTSKFSQVTRLAADFARLNVFAHLDADISGFVSGFGQAVQLGVEFSQLTFSANLTLNTSGAVAAAQSAASFIDSLLPHSPAKAGPLRVLPNWDALFEGMGPAAQRGTGHVDAHLARLHGYHGNGVYGGDGAQGKGDTHVHLGGITVKGDVNGIEDWERKMQDVALETFETVARVVR